MGSIEIHLAGLQLAKPIDIGLSFGEISITLGALWYILSSERQGGNIAPRQKDLVAESLDEIFLV